MNLNRQVSPWPVSSGKGFSGGIINHCYGDDVEAYRIEGSGAIKEIAIRPVEPVSMDENIDAFTTDEHLGQFPKGAAALEALAERGSSEERNWFVEGFKDGYRRKYDAVKGGGEEFRIMQPFEEKMADEEAAVDERSRECVDTFPSPEIEAFYKAGFVYGSVTGGYQYALGVHEEGYEVIIGQRCVQSEETEGQAVQGFIGRNDELNYIYGLMLRGQSGETDRPAFAALFNEEVEQSGWTQRVADPANAESRRGDFEEVMQRTGYLVGPFYHIPSREGIRFKMEQDSWMREHYGRDPFPGTVAFYKHYGCELGNDELLYTSGRLTDRKHVIGLLGALREDGHVTQTQVEEIVRKFDLGTEVDRGGDELRR